MKLIDKYTARSTDTQEILRDYIPLAISIRYEIHFIIL